MKPLTKKWKCPSCAMEFMAGMSVEDGRCGRRCPAGHFHDYYELKRFEEGKPLRAAVAQARAQKVTADLVPARSRNRWETDRAQMLALLWVGAIDRLLSQMPEGSVARAMIDGATEQAYRVSKRVMNEPEGGGALESEAA